MGEGIQANTGSAAEMAMLRRYTGDDATGAGPNKLDINLVSRQTLEALGFSTAVATALQDGRPYFSLADALAARFLGADDVDMLQRWFSVTPFQFDGRIYADDTEWVVRTDVASQSEALSMPVRHEYHRVQQRPERTPESRGVIHTFPALTDEHGAVRHLDPEYIVVQAACDSGDARLLNLLQLLNLREHRQLPSRGLLVVCVGGARHGPAAMMSALAALQGSDLIELAEPAWLGFDDLQSAQFDVAPLDTEAASTPWNFALLKAGDFWRVGKGDPAVTLACVDTGVDGSHPAFQSLPGMNTERSYLDFTGSDNDDDNGHGTSVAGLMVGNGNGTAAGLAPACGLLSLKVLLQPDVTSYASRRAALMYLVERAEAGQKLVVNLSWRTSGDVAMIRTAIEALSQAGALVVCSAGNDGNQESTPHFPSDYPQTISVAAADQTGALTSYSNAGPMVDIMAPGGSDVAPLVCCLPGGSLVNRIGTSFAAPQIAAAAALAWSIKPSWTGEQVRAALEASTGAGLSMPDLGVLAASLTTPGTETTPPPVRPGQEAWAFPVSGVSLANAARGGQLLPITLRIFSSRTSWSSWREIAAVLGMDAARLATLRAALEPNS